MNTQNSFSEFESMWGIQDSAKCQNAVWRRRAGLGEKGQTPACRPLDRKRRNVNLAQ